MQTSSLEESGLLTSGNHHVPGYGGFCPKMRFLYGKTYGQTTASLLADDEVTSSGNTVLGRTSLDNTHKAKVEEFRTHLINTRDGDNKYGDSMVPGYMGYVPRTQNYFGSNYTEVCKNSTADLELDRRKVALRKDEIEFIKAVQDGDIKMAPEDMPPQLQLSPRAVSKATSNQATPLASPRVTPRPVLISPELKSYTPSPYSIHNQDPGKTFKAGFSGFVPRSRELFGHGYPSICNKALNNFQEDRRLKQYFRDAHVNAHTDGDRKQISRPPSPSPRPLYPEETGMTPRYTGHIPGVRFRHGLTFGHSTKNTKNFQMPDVSD